MATPTVTLELYRTKSLRRSQRWSWRLKVGAVSVAVAGEGYEKLSFARGMGGRVASGYYRNARLEVYRTRSLRRSQRWAWRLWIGSQLIASSGEGYYDQDEATRMGTRVRSGAYDGALVVEPGRAR